MKFIFYKNKKIIIVSILSLVLSLSFITLPWPDYFLKKIIVNNHKYFLLGQNAETKINKIFFQFVDLKLQQKIYLKLKINKGVKENNKIIIEQIIHTVSDLILDQKDFEKINYIFPLLTASTGSIAIRGYGACDEINGVLNIAMNQIDSHSMLYSIMDTKINQSPHTLVKFKLQNDYFFADAWNGSRLFYINKPNFNELEDVMPFSNNLYELDLKKEFFQNGFILNQTNISFRIKKIYLRLKNILFNQNIIEVDSSENIKKQKKVINLDKKNNLNNHSFHNAKLYIDARFYHLNKKYKLALRNYDLVNKSNCKEIFCKAAKIFSKEIKNKILD